MSPVKLLTGLAVLTLLVAPAPADAQTPRSERVTRRVAERAYARASIAEAKAARAQERVEAIAPVVPVPPPPRPATVRRLLRAGIPPEAIIAATRPPVPAPAQIVPAPVAGFPQTAAAPASAAPPLPSSVAIAPRQSPPPLARATAPRIPGAPRAPTPPATPEEPARLDFPSETATALDPALRHDDGTKSVLVSGQEADERPTPAPLPAATAELIPAPSPK